MPSKTTPQVNRIRLLTGHLGREFRPERLLPAVTAGLINGVLVISVEISFAAMIFGGDLSVYVSKGIGLTLFGCVVIGMIVTLTSSY
ncbi:MAG: hypothetical protein MUO52_07505, partial [Desulfobacterales bacterium]|nr:hypothetical protein [Desulfobacterales bacterium]